MKKLENEKKFEELFSSFDEKGDTLFSITACGNHEAVVSACGEQEKASDLVCAILKDGLAKGAESEHIATMIPIMDGIRKLIAMKCDESCKFVETVSRFMEEAECDDNEYDDDDDDGFCPTSEECMDCDGYVDCLKKHLKDLGFEVEVKKVRKPKKKNGK